MPTEKIIGHLDADCFYVSAERVRHTRLAVAPVGVIGNQGACVIAKSYEMKASGVKTGMPIWDAIKLCPDRLYAKRNFRWYEILSRLMLDIVREYSQKVEYYSIDEFFFDATPPRGETPDVYGLRIRDAIWQRLRIPVTVGIARTRTLAKLISETAKPFGARAVFGREEEEALLANLPITEVSGIAGKRERRLFLVRSLLTATGEALWWELNGDPVIPIQPRRIPHKIISRGGSFGEPTDKPQVLFAWLVRNIERLIEELENHKVLTARMALWVGYRDGGAGEGRTSLPVPSDRFESLLEALRPCLWRAWLPRAMAGRMHLFAEDLRPKECRQLGLFESGEAVAAAMAKLKHGVNVKHGRFVLRSAATLPLNAIYADRANEYDICDVRGKVCF